MLISHSNKFIFIKPEKVASTSVQVALAINCQGAEDVITPVSYKKGMLPDYYKPKNYKKENFRTHSPPIYIKKHLEAALWEEYTKITIVRNPWETLVSLYKHLCSLRPPADPNFLKKYPTLDAWIDNGCSLKGHKRAHQHLVERSGYFEPTNNRYYFWTDGATTADLYLRLETLQEDLARLVKNTALVLGPQLHFKTSSARTHYSAYMSEKAVAFVTEQCKQQIDFFGYSFERKLSYLDHPPLEGISVLDKY